MLWPDQHILSSGSMRLNAGRESHFGGAAWFIGFRSLVLIDERCSCTPTLRSPARRPNSGVDFALVEGLNDLLVELLLATGVPIALEAFVLVAGDHRRGEDRDALQPTREEHNLSVAVDVLLIRRAQPPSAPTERPPWLRGSRAARPRRRRGRRSQSRLTSETLLQTIERPQNGAVDDM